MPNLVQQSLVGLEDILGLFTHNGEVAILRQLCAHQDEARQQRGDREKILKPFLGDSLGSTFSSEILASAINLTLVATFRSTSTAATPISPTNAEIRNEVVVSLKGLISRPAQSTRTTTPSRNSPVTAARTVSVPLAI